MLAKLIGVLVRTALAMVNSPANINGAERDGVCNPVPNVSITIAIALSVKRFGRGCKPRPAWLGETNSSSFLSDTDFVKLELRKQANLTADAGKRVAQQKSQ